MAAVQSNQYDLLNRLTSHKESIASTNDASYSYVYDNVNRLTQMTGPDPDGMMGPQTAPVTSYTYDANGNRLTETDPLGKVTTNAYDNLNRLTQVTSPDPDGAGPLTSPVTKYAYDALNEMTSLTDPDNNATTWAYDGLGRTTVVTNSLGKTDTYGYDAASNLTSHTDRDGRLTNYVYDNLQRRTQEKWMSGGTPIETFNYAYDANNKLTSASATAVQVAPQSRCVSLPA